MKPGSAKSIVKKTYQEWSEDKSPKLAAALAYYTAFSIAPLLLLVIGIASLFFGQEAARGEILAQLGSLVGTSAAETISGVLDNLNKKGHGVMATVVGGVTLLIGATGVFGELQDSLNRIWEVRPKPSRGLWSYLKRRFLSLGMILVIGFLLLVSLVLTTAMSGAIKYLGDILPGADILWQIATVVISFALVTVLFAAMFKVLPDAKMAWKDVFVGAIATAVLFTIGKTLIGLYLGRSSTASTFGAAGSFVVLLVWVYYSAQIVFFGAEFTQVYANEYGSGITPKEGAEYAPDQLGQSATRQARQEKKFGKPPPKTSHRVTLEAVQPQSHTEWLLLHGIRNFFKKHDIQNNSSKKRGA
jgi:membrane protein